MGIYSVTINYYIAINADNEITQRYTTKFQRLIPDGVIELSEDDYQQSLNSTHYINGELVNIARVISVEEQWATLKRQRQIELDDSRVTLSSGAEMDGNELAYNRMKNASDALLDDVTTVEFTDANNNQVHLTKALLREGFLLGAQQHSTIWANYAALRIALV